MTGQDKKTVVVLGMHRSGTSLTAGLLQILGVDMGQQLLPANQFNTKGYFEDTDFVDLNEEILKETGGSWYKPPSEERVKGAGEVLGNKIKYLITKKQNAPNQIWGWKDPRTALFLNLYYNYLNNPYFIVCLRNPYEVANSLAERDELSVLDSLNLFNIYSEKIVNFFKKHSGNKLMFLSFEDLIKNPIEQSKKLSEFIGIKFNSEMGKNILNLITPPEEISKTKIRVQKETENRLANELTETKKELAEIINSRSWRLIMVFKKIKMVGRNALRILSTHGLIGFLKQIYLFIDRYLTFRKLRSLDRHCSKISLGHSSGVSKKTKLKILFFSGCDSEAVKRYRVYNTVNLLNSVGIEATVLNSRNIKRALDYLADFDAVVFSRIGLNENNSRLIAILQKNNTPCIFEIDDYLFDQKTSNYIDAIGYLNQTEQQLYLNLIKSYQDMLLTCTYFLTTTDFLAQRGNEMGKKSYIIRNSLNDRQIATAETIIKEAHNKETGVVTLGYFSGSHTHSADFETIVPTLKQVMEKYKDVILHLGGCIFIPLSLQKFKNRIKILPFVHWEKLPYNIARVDINLVPLEYNNPFCDGKSEIKYLEAGILGIPTIATATDTHRHIIKQGTNGFVAHNEAEWGKYLMLLIENSGLRKKIGLNARQHILENYTPSIQKDRVKQVFEDILNKKTTTRHETAGHDRRYL